MNMIFTQKKVPFSKSLPVSAPPTHVERAPDAAPIESHEELRSLESYSKYKDIASMPNTFSDRATMFSGRNMFSRIGTTMGGCSSCGLRQKSNKPLKKNNIY